MFCAVLLGDGRGALQAEVCGRERRDGVVVGVVVVVVQGLGRLPEEGIPVEDASQDRLVVMDRRVGGRLVLIEESLEVFLGVSAGTL